MHELGDDMYTSPWSRILPYLIGVGSGWILLNQKHSLNINKVIKLRNGMQQIKCNDADPISFRCLHRNHQITCS